jgi:tripartite-type tricarboxylate transporter receptor subunit TctC
VLAVTNPERTPAAPDIPTVAEQGFAELEVEGTIGLFGPAALPKDLVMKIDKEAIRIFSDPAFRTKFLDPQMFESMAGPPEEFAAYIQAERAKWAKVIHEANIKIE